MAPKECIGADVLVPLAWRLEVRVYDLVAEWVDSSGDLIIRSRFPAVHSQRAVLEKLAHRGGPHHSGEVRGFQPVFNAE